MRWLLSIAMISTLVAAAPGDPQAAGRRACLRWNDIDTITRSGPDTVLVKSRRRGDWQIKFKGHCDYMRSPDNFFIVRLHSRWECVDSLGTIDVHNAGACFIESVTPIR